MELEKIWNWNIIELKEKNSYCLLFLLIVLVMSLANTSSFSSKLQ